MKIIRKYSDKEEDFQEAIRLLAQLIMKRPNKNNIIMSTSTEEKSAKQKTRS